MSRDTDATTMPAPTHQRRTRQSTNATRRPKVNVTKATDTDDSTDESLPLSEQEEKRRIYVDHEPQMRRYKKDMFSCVHDDQHDLILQRMPRDPADIQYKTTCGHMYCKSWNGVFELGSYRVSVEEKENLDAESPFSGAIPLQPLHKWSPALARCKQVPANIITPDDSLLVLIPRPYRA